MRKLAREAVIFMLLVPLFVFVGAFIYFYHDAHKPVVLDMSASQPIPCLEGDKYTDQGRLVWSCQNGVRTGVFDLNAPIDLSAGFVPKPPPISELMLNALVFAFYGIPAGLGLWILYRIVRFAITG